MANIEDRPLRVTESPVVTSLWYQCEAPFREQPWIERKIFHPHVVLTTEDVHHEMLKVFHEFGRHVLAGHLRNAAQNGMSETFAASGVSGRAPLHS